MTFKRSFRLAFSAMLLAGTAGTALAQDNDKPATPETTGSQAQGVAAAATPSIQSSLGAYGDPGGIRAALEKKGITYNFTYIGEVLGNTSGGVKRGATYEGRLDGQLDLDFEKIAGVKDLTGHAQFFQIHGRGLSGNNLIDLFTTSNIEAFPSTKLYEAWLEQKLADGKLFVRAGQLAADTEFFISQSATLFVNSTFGFPAIYANDLPSGGPAYPLATPAVRVKYQPNDKLTLLAALFNGDPAGPFNPGVNDFLPQLRDPSGTNFRLKDPPLLFAEAQYAYNQEKDAKGLPGTIKLGYVHHFGQFQAANQFLFTGATFRGEDSGYLIIDQTLYRKPNTDDQGLSGFLRVSGAPQDRNLIDFYVDGGFAYKGLFPNRPDDTAGVAVAYGRVSPQVSASDIALGNAPLIRDFQAAIELTYQYTVIPGFTVQPDFQYVFHPGAHGVADPNDGNPIRDAAVFGVRATIHY